jgi:hypothetical protein
MIVTKHKKCLPRFVGLPASLQDRAHGYRINSGMLAYFIHVV